MKTIGWSLDEAYGSFGKRPDHSLEFGEMGISPSILDRHPRTCNGGEPRWVAILRAMANDPEYLLLDEPTSMLDLSLQASIMDIVLRGNRERGMLIASHDLALLRRVCDRFYVIENGTCREIEMSELPEIPDLF